MTYIYVYMAGKWPFGVPKHVFDQISIYIWHLGHFLENRFFWIFRPLKIFFYIYIRKNCKFRAKNMPKHIENRFIIIETLSKKFSPVLKALFHFLA